MLELIKELDIKAFLFFNGIHSEFWDMIMLQVSKTFIWVPLYLLVLVLLVRKFKWNALLVIFAIILLTIITDKISVHLFKETIQRLRPSHNPELSGIIHLVNNVTGGKYGFVSSHAANTFGFAVFTSLIFKARYYSIPILLWAAIVSYSRIYLGLHYPLDIVGGAITGSLLALLIYTLYRNFFIPLQEKFVKQKMPE